MERVLVYKDAYSRSRVTVTNTSDSNVYFHLYCDFKLIFCVRTNSKPRFVVQPAKFTLEPHTSVEVQS